METRQSSIHTLLALLILAIIIAECAPTADAFREVQASDVLSQIKEGMPVYYDSVIITGDLNLSSLDPYNVRNSIAIINSSIPECNFRNVIFNSGVTFSGTRFGNASFSESDFRKEADFSNTSWSDQANNGHPS